MPGVPAIQLVLGLFAYKPTKKVLDEATRCRPSRSRRAGRPGRQLLNDIDIYLAGINLWYSQNSPATRRSRAPTSTRSTGSSRSSWARAAARRSTTPRSSTRALQARRQPRRRGLRGPARALRPRDHEHDDAKLPRPDQGQRVQAARHGAHATAASVRPRPSSPPRRRRRGRAATVDHPLRAAAARQQHPDRERQGVATGSPLFVGGPQIGYNYPGLTMEMELDGPDIHVAARPPRRSPATCSSAAAPTTRGR